MRLTIGVLGPVVAADDGGALDLPRARERAVLSALALAHPRPVTVEGLLDALWGEAGGGTPQTIRSYVSRLRHLLGAGSVTSGPAGYALAVPRDAIDVHCSEALLADAASALRLGDNEAARAAAKSGLELWRGMPFAELATPAADVARAALARRQDELHHIQAEALLRTGRAAEAVEVLAPVCAAGPLDEPLWALWIRALGADGRRDEALRRYDQIRLALSADLGISPGDGLTAAHASIVQQRPVSSTPPVEQGYVDRDGRAIAYVRVGDRGPALLFLHGGLLASEMMLEEPSALAFLRNLAAHRRVFMVDVGGIGLSDPVKDGALSFEGWADDIAAVLGAVAVGQVDVLAMGFSFGAGMCLAVRHPQRVRRVVFGNSPAIPRLSGLILEDALAQIDAGPAGRGGSTQFLTPSRIGDEAFTDWMERSARRGTGPSTARAVFRLLFRADMLALAPRVRVPVLVLERRPAVGSGAEMDALVAALPDAVHVVHDGVDALPFVGDSDGWLAAALGFLDAADERLVRLVAVAATAAPGGPPIVSLHDTPAAAAAAASQRLQASGGVARAVVHVGLAQPGSRPSGPAVEAATRALVPAPPGRIERTAAFDAVAETPHPLRMTRNRQSG